MCIAQGSIICLYCPLTWSYICVLPRAVLSVHTALSHSLIYVYCPGQYHLFVLPSHMVLCMCSAQGSIICLYCPLTWSYVCVVPRAVSSVCTALSHYLLYVYCPGQYHLFVLPSHMVFYMCTIQGSIVCSYCPLTLSYICVLHRAVLFVLECVPQYSASEYQQIAELSLNKVKKKKKMYHE